MIDYEIQQKFLIEINRRFLQECDNNTFFNTSKLKSINNKYVESPASIFKDPKIYIKGKKFLQGLNELHDLFKSDCDGRKIVKELIEEATLLLQFEQVNPSVGLNQFDEKIESLRMKINSKEGLSSSVGFCNFVIHALSAGLGIILTGFGLYAAYSNILIFATIATLSSGPWGWLAFSCGVITVGLVMAGMLAYDAYTNYRFYEETQISDIQAFADLLQPVIAKNEGVLNDNNIENSYTALL